MTFKHDPYYWEKKPLTGNMLALRKSVFARLDGVIGHLIITECECRHALTAEERDAFEEARVALSRMLDSFPT